MPDSNSTTPVTPLRCFTGSLTAGGLGTLCYLLMHSIATTFASKPLTAHNITALNIGVAVRTLVVGLATLATGVFAMATIGLLALGIQLLFKGQPQQSSNPE
ncbi:MAG: DUF3082 domain-containing protein [Spirulina sp. SIO3F2]|nr:DUF3082 domain-containing protein [Spirulina sp. SIO3F2]